ncbi:MAG TPA: cytochrome c biogenesis protein ResB [Thermodesulfobacteriaceae bacterium]|nr:cytochrome c biogenesis protein ResB [Thermodesulfobacteriaceae bacterium]
MKKIVDFFSSLRLAIFLFLALAITSILGTILPQGKEPGFYFAKYGSFWGKIISFFQLYDAYHSWWYIALLSVFLLNLIFCSVKRFPVSLGLYRRDPWSVDPEKLPMRKEIITSKSPEELKSSLEKEFDIKALKEGFLGVKDRFRWSYFSVYFVHGSILVIVIGALIGAIYGYRGYMNILEGEKSNKVFPFQKKGYISLPFYIKLDKFEIEFYPNGMPKDYRSHVTVIDGNQSFNYLIRVNHPLEYKKIRFYQSSYQEYAAIKIRVEIGNKSKDLVIKPFRDGNWEEEDLTIGLIQYGEAHGFRMAKIWITKEGYEPQIIWLIEGHRQELSFSPHKIFLSMLEAKPIFMTGLQVRKDPGAILVWIGFLLMILGTFAAFFFTHRVIWVYIRPHEKGSRVIVGGYSKRYREDLKKQIERFVNKYLIDLT